MDKKKILYLFLMITIVVVAMLIYSNRARITNEELLIGDGSYSTEKIEESNLIVMISNQWNESGKVNMQGSVDNEQLFRGSYEAGNQHLVSYYYKDLSEGEHTLVVKSEDGANLQEKVNISEKKLWVYITYWNQNGSEPKFNIMTQFEPIFID